MPAVHRLIPRYSGSLEDCTKEKGKTKGSVKKGNTTATTTNDDGDDRTDILVTSVPPPLGHGVLFAAVTSPPKQTVDSQVCFDSQRLPLPTASSLTPAMKDLRTSIATSDEAHQSPTLTGINLHHVISPPSVPAHIDREGEEDLLSFFPQSLVIGGVPHNTDDSKQSQMNVFSSPPRAGLKAVGGLEHPSLIPTPRRVFLPPTPLPASSSTKRDDTYAALPTTGERPKYCQADGAEDEEDLFPSVVAFPTTFNVDTNLGYQRQGLLLAPPLSTSTCTGSSTHALPLFEHASIARENDSSRHRSVLVVAEHEGEGEGEEDDGNERGQEGIASSSSSFGAVSPLQARIQYYFPLASTFGDDDATATSTRVFSMSAPSAPPHTDGPPRCKRADDESAGAFGEEEDAYMPDGQRDWRGRRVERVEDCRPKAGARDRNLEGAAAALEGRSAAEGEEGANTEDEGDDGGAAHSTACFTGVKRARSYGLGAAPRTAGAKNGNCAKGTNTYGDTTSREPSTPHTLRSSTCCMNPVVVRATRVMRASLCPYSDAAQLTSHTVKRRLFEAAQLTMVMGHASDKALSAASRWAKRQQKLLQLQQQVNPDHLTASGAPPMRVNEEEVQAVHLKIVSPQSAIKMNSSGGGTGASGTCGRGDITGSFKGANTPPLAFFEDIDLFAYCLVSALSTAATDEEVCGLLLLLSPSRSDAVRTALGRCEECKIVSTTVYGDRGADQESGKRGKMRRLRREQPFGIFQQFSSFLDVMRFDLIFKEHIFLPSSYTATVACATDVSVARSTSRSGIAARGTTFYSSPSPRPQRGGPFYSPSTKATEEKGLFSVGSCCASPPPLHRNKTSGTATTTSLAVAPRQSESPFSCVNGLPELPSSAAAVLYPSSSSSSPPLIATWLLQTQPSDAPLLLVHSDAKASSVRRLLTNVRSLLVLQCFDLIAHKAPTLGDRVTAGLQRMLLQNAEEEREGRVSSFSSSSFFAAEAFSTPSLISIAQLLASRCPQLRMSVTYAVNKHLLNQISPRFDAVAGWGRGGGDTDTWGTMGRAAVLRVMLGSPAALFSNVTLSEIELSSFSRAVVSRIAASSACGTGGASGGEPIMQALFGARRGSALLSSSALSVASLLVSTVIFWMTHTGTSARKVNVTLRLLLKLFQQTMDAGGGLDHLHRQGAIPVDRAATLEVFSNVGAPLPSCVQLGVLVANVESIVTDAAGLRESKWRGQQSAEPFVVSSFTSSSSVSYVSERVVPVIRFIQSELSLPSMSEITSLVRLAEVRARSPRSASKCDDSNELARGISTTPRALTRGQGGSTTATPQRYPSNSMRSSQNYTSPSTVGSGLFSIGGAQSTTHASKRVPSPMRWSFVYNPSPPTSAGKERATPSVETNASSNYTVAASYDVRRAIQLEKEGDTTDANAADTEMDLSEIVSLSTFLQPHYNTNSHHHHHQHQTAPTRADTAARGVVGGGGGGGGGSLLPEYLARLQNSVSAAYLLG